MNNLINYQRLKLSQYENTVKLDEEEVIKIII